MDSKKNSNPSETSTMGVHILTISTEILKFSTHFHNKSTMITIPEDITITCLLSTALSVKTGFISKDQKLNSNARELTLLKERG